MILELLPFITTYQKNNTIFTQMKYEGKLSGLAKGGLDGSVVISVYELYQAVTQTFSEFGARLKEHLPAPERGRWGVQGVFACSLD
jgi:hypothetical protein